MEAEEEGAEALEGAVAEEELTCDGEVEFAFGGVDGVPRGSGS